MAPAPTSRSSPVPATELDPNRSERWLHPRIVHIPERGFGRAHGNGSLEYPRCQRHFRFGTGPNGIVMRHALETYLVARLGRPRLDRAARDVES